MGSIPFSIIVSKLKGINLLEHGSKNAGATNVYRLLGLKYAILVFLLDASKGLLGIYLSQQLNPENHLLIMLSGLAVIIGHTFTPFLKFKGGKGVATGLGILIGLTPLIALIGFICASTIIITTRVVSVASITTSLLVVALALTPVFAVPLLYKIFISIAVAYIIYRHLPNIKRILKGTENRV